ncbi:ABC transporter ATP-binding protein [Georgenia faecalis]|uniref:ABC transporter ATP-binding protein n=1 Tax=Georgenia faecalis TaxID=2483799 RepID=A0ABV9DAG3_9MICO|nr:oligopeptide/dipeptide ABC transporter ATP-binding protein [Georgenia faecalis]
MSAPLLQVNDLETHFRVPGGVVRAVDGVSFTIRRGMTFGLVGESGSGKSTLGRSVLQLVRPTSGSVKFNGRELVAMKAQELRSMRRSMQLVFQDPYASLNPRMTVAETLEAPLRIHKLVPRSQRRAEAERLLDMVGLPARFAERYPHEFSGGQRQRIGIARALATRPELIVCDEPISALDVSIQAQILNLLLELQREHGLTYLFISHDLSVVQHIADEVAVLYLGRLAEIGRYDAVFNHPQHPYTRALLAAVPDPDPLAERRRQHTPLAGEIPSPLDPPSGCRFRTRCPLAFDRCVHEVPLLRRDPHGRSFACHAVDTP